MTRSYNRRPIQYMFGGLIKHPSAIVFALLLAVLSTVLLTLPSVFVGLAIDELESSTAITPTLVTYVWMIVGSAIIYMAIYFVSGYVWAVVTLRWERDARQEFLEILQEYSMTFHDMVDSKRMLSVAMQDINWVRLSLNPALRNIAGGLASFGIIGILLALVDIEAGLTMPIFSLIMFVGTPIYLIFAYKYASTIEPLRRTRSETMEQITSMSQGVFQGIEVVRAFGAEDREMEKFRKVANRYEEIVSKEGRLSAFYIPALILIAMTTTAFIYGGFSVLESALTIGTYIRVITLLVSLTSLNFFLPRMLLMLRGGIVNAKRIVDLLNWKDPLVEPEQPAQVDWSGDIVFDNVSFKYNSENGSNDHYALKDFSLTIPGGSKVALIGGPGGGKSTILKLLLRLYDPTEGTVSIGGVDIRQVNTKNLRDAISLVEQDTFLFRMSVRENIAFGHPSATDDEVRDAAIRAQAHEFIVNLPEGYESMVGEKGMTLSGGQRQRLAIARALIQDPRVLLLDDSVSAVDAKTELLMRKALEEVLRGRTSITVTQRLRTLIESDLVVIVDRGFIIATGSHEELLLTSEHYRRIFMRLPGADTLLETKIKKEGVS